MTQDMKVLDTETWGEEHWANAGEVQFAGPDFSPNIQNDSGSSIGSTISPSDIHMNPHMNGFTSPYSALIDSPDGYDTSPLFGADDVSDTWYSLFPEETPESEESGSVAASTKKQHTGDGASPTSTDSPDTSPRFRGSSQKRSSTSGVRKRPTKLPPIVVEDPTDVVALKRARNTLAARKSRAKKAEKMEDMEATIEDLKAQVEHWKAMYHRSIGR